MEWEAAVVFQGIDDKKECVGLYYNSNYVFKNIDFTKLTGTWKHSAASLEHDHIEYAWLRCRGKTLEEVCPPALKHEWDEASSKMDAFYKSLKASKVSLNENCLFEIIPPGKFSRFLDIKNKITEYVFDNFKKPKEYEHLRNVVEMLEDIKHRTVNIDYASLRSEIYNEKNRNLFKKLKTTRNSVSYKLFGTKTGRLTVEKGHFPVLTLDKNQRKFIRPNNDLFVEIDINGAEIRTLLALLGRQQPEVDIHDWNAQNVFEGLSRDQAKKRFFAWLYNPNSEDSLCSEVYDRESIKNMYWDGDVVTTPYFRSIASDEYHCVNYILQSTSNDVCLEQSKKVFDFLKEKKSKIAFLMHDSIIIDFCSEERELVGEIIELFQNTRFGKYKTNVQIGRNFGDMRELKWKQ